MSGSRTTVRLEPTAIRSRVAIPLSGPIAVGGMLKHFFFIWSSVQES